jgi:hypothetical protein
MASSQLARLVDFRWMRTNASLTLSTVALETGRDNRSVYTAYANHKWTVWKVG